MKVKGFNVDGVVYQAFSGCHLYEMYYKGVGKALEAEGIDALVSKRIIQASKDRTVIYGIEAFMESIKTERSKL